MVTNDMIEPCGPFLELSFYKANINSSDYFFKLFNALTLIGAKYSGVARYFDKVGRDQNISSVTDFEMREKRIDRSEVRLLMEERGIKVVQTLFEGVIGFNKDLYEVLTYQYVSQEALIEEQTILSIWVDGNVYFEASGEQLAEFNQRLSVVFKSIVDEIEPDYAVVTDEASPLEVPLDLEKHGGSLAFKNCYISDKFMSEDKLKQLLNQFDLEGWHGSKGMFVYSGWSGNISSDDFSEELSKFIAKKAR